MISSLRNVQNMENKPLISDDNNKIIDTYNKIAEDYYKLRESLILKDEIDYMIIHTPANGVILDAGCGNGRDASIFSKEGKQVVAVDFSQRQIRIANKRLNNNNSVNIILGDLRRIQFPPCGFDGIWCCAVMPHFNDSTIRNIMKKFYTSLKPNGIAIITFKKGDCEKMVVEKEFNGITRYTNFHKEEQIIDFIIDAGFTKYSLSMYNEQERFGMQHRNLDFIIATLTK